jgi:negative regulator of sigma E activity
MLDLPENELFSAYIDGELTAEEQAEVEQILNANPEAQQLVDELRSLSSSLQSLPAYTLDEDLAARVLRQAEREMLAEPATPLPRFHHVDVPEAKPTSWARRLLRPKNFAWSAVAIAVAVILMLNESGTNNNGASNNVAQVPKSVTIEPLDVVPTVEAMEALPVPTVAQATEPEVPSPDEPKVAAPAPEPTMVAETAADAAPETVQEAIKPKEETDPLLVLQCQLAEGSIGHEALAKLLEQAGVALDKPISKDGGSVEFTLTTSQVRQVVSQLETTPDAFTGYSFPSTPTKAGPRIPSAVGPGAAHSHDMTAAEGSETKKPPKATFHVQGTITIKPKSLPVKDDCTYRVRFVLKPAAGTAEEKAPADR